jgi:hypothetical protein
MAPANGASDVLIHRTQTSPLFAALINGASSHFAEQDDVHNGSVFHPAAVVFPPALATAQWQASSGEALLTAAVAGYWHRGNDCCSGGHWAIARVVARADVACLWIGRHASRGFVGVFA